MCTKHLNSQLKVLLSLLTHTHTHPLYKHSEEELLGLLGVYFIWNQSLSFLICNQAKDPSGLLGEEGAPMRGRNAASSPRGFINNSYGWVSSAKWRNGGKESPAVFLNLQLQAGPDIVVCFWRHWKEGCGWMCYISHLGDFFLDEA